MGGEEGDDGEVELMRYLFHTSNSINDFIDLALSHILSHSQANEMGNQAISQGWQRSGFSLSKKPHKSHLLLPAGTMGSSPLACGEEAGWLFSHFCHQKLQALISTNSNGLASIDATHFHLTICFHNFFGRKKNPLLRFSILGLC